MDSNFTWHNNSTDCKLFLLYFISKNVYININMNIYRIRLIGSKLDTVECPPEIVYLIFPNFSNWEVYLSENECIINVPENETPIDLGPLIKIEKL